MSHVKSRPAPPSVFLARKAMATRFEMLLHGADPVSLRAAAEEAFSEIERLDRELSFYHPGSQVSRINARAEHEPVPVEPVVFQLLLAAVRIHRETAGAFDITIGPLMHAWGLTGAGGRIPTRAALAAARQRTGLQHIQLDPDNFTVRFTRPGLQIDLGAIGKGFALERAAQILRELGITSALLHGGTSTVCAIGHPPDAPAWNIGIDTPPARSHKSAPPKTPILAVIPLRDTSLSVSAVWGKSFAARGQTFGHVIDPRSAAPTPRAQPAPIVHPSATTSDALSTALLTLGPPGLKLLLNHHPEIQALVAREPRSGQTPRVTTHGIVPRAA